AALGGRWRESIRLFREQSEVLRQYQARFRYILVDEYQDTNVAQYLWLRLLGQSMGRSTVSTDSKVAVSRDSAAGSTSPQPKSDLSDFGQSKEPTSQLKNICCVGDDDQSIYGWRGAEVDNILRFGHDFPGARIIRLERNYRSHGHILAAASYLIAHNEGRLGKTPRTEEVDGEKATDTG